jgi:hypothetical protein
MSLQSHLNSLRERHQKLEGQIRDANSHYSDDTLVHSLKRQKLACKEEIDRIAAQLTGES